MSYLEMAKQAQVRLNLARSANADNASNAEKKSGGGYRAEDAQVPPGRGNAETRELLDSPATGAPPRPSAHASGDPVLDHASEYRAALRQAFALIALGPAAEILDCQRVLGEEARLVDELGVARADAIRATVARAWYRETGRCPLCGEPGRFHDPENQHG